MELLLQESKIMFKYTISFSNKSKKELVSGKSDDYNTAFDKAQSIVKSLFSEAVLSEKFNDLIASPDYLVYENGKDKIFLKIEKA